MSVTPKSFFARSWIYSKEMFPVLVYLPYIIALYVCLNFSTQALGGKDLVVDIYSVVGMVSAFFMMLLMRTYDDLKDFDLDKEIFPHRATPRLLVLKSDIATISIFSFSVLVLVNVFLAHNTLIIFFIMLTYTFLTYKWFFAEQFHRDHVFFTMATHQPIPYVINFFMIHTALATGGVYEAFNMNHFLLLLIFSLPVTAWEVSRKIRSKDMEDDYETFSILLGARGATIIPYICLLVAGAITIYMGFVMELSTSFFIVTGIALLYFKFFYLRFLMKPIHKYNNLKDVAMIYTSVLFFNFLIHIILISNISFNL